MRNYGRHDDFVFFAGKKNDYRAIIFDLVNHKKYKEAIKNLINYLSYSAEEDYLKELIKIFFMYINIFVKESPKDVIELLNSYYHLIDNPRDILRIIINLDDVYNNKMDEDIFDNVLKFIKKFISPKNNKKMNDMLNFDDNSRQNFYNLYILYLSKSFKMEHNIELNEYLKTLIIDMNKSKNKYSLNKNDKNKIYFEFSFAENLFKNNKSALALLYCLKRQYKKSISIACECRDKNISFFIANSVTNQKKKKEIWLLLFNNFKSKGMKIVEEILQKSNGILTITDILPHLMGNVQLKDIETNLNKCIGEYEIKLRKLKRNIKEFSKSEEILNKKISKIVNYGQKTLKMKLEDIICSICLRNLKEKNFFIFPCKHAFDFDCLINLLLYYDKKGIGDDKFKNKMLSIKSTLKLFQSVQDIINKSPLDKKGSLNLTNKAKSENVIKGFFRNLTFRNSIENNNYNYLDNEQKILNSKIGGLYELLNEECPLCGDEIILGTQTQFGNDNNMDWSI